AQEAIRDAVRDGSLSSAHDVAEGGLLIAVAESCLAGGIGATLEPGARGARGAEGGGERDAVELDRVLFGESPGSGFIVSGRQDALRRLGEHIALEMLGTVGGEALCVVSGELRIEAALDELRRAHGALAPLFA
ncbi:MAG: AIR synthase-related protein, partial [Actinomycetota bacterium]|nr:AIR synthase-related protein [Actinomycetota bacterium]